MLSIRSKSGLSRRNAKKARQAAVGVNSNFESLESRQFLSVSLGSDGYTDVVKSGDSKVIYVSSSSGSDTNSGSSQSSPVRSVAKGISLLRSGMPDQLLLKSGDSWTENPTLSKGGRSSQEPMLLGSYGTGARPLIKAGSGIGLEMSSGTVNHVVVQGLHFFAHTRDPNMSGYRKSSGDFGIQISARTAGVLIEDTVVDQFKFNIVAQGAGDKVNNVVIRKSIITDAYAIDGGKSSGMFAQEVNGITLEDNIFDHNGWNANVSGSGANMYNHNAYLSHANNNIVVKGNIFADASSHGLQTRAGGDVTGNIFLRNPIGMSYGMVNGDYLKAGGVSGRVEGNVFLETRAIGTSQRGWGIEAGNIKFATIKNNIFTDDSNGVMAAIKLDAGQSLLNTSSGVGINNLTIEDNIVNQWHASIELGSALKMGGSGNSSVNNLTVRDNQFQYATGSQSRLVIHAPTFNSSEESWSNNRYYDEAEQSKWFIVNSTPTSFSGWKSRSEGSASASKITYNNAGADMGSYAGSYDNFIDGARDQEHGSWNSKYSAKNAIAYMRSAFNVDGQVIPEETTPVVIVPPTTGAPSLTAADASVFEGSSGLREVQVPVKLNVASSQTVKVGYYTGNQSAGEGDYVATSGTITFAPGETTKSIAVEVKGDTRIELDEKFRVNLTGATNATIAVPEVLATITNDDGAGAPTESSTTPTEPTPTPTGGTPMVLPSDASIDEGDSGEKMMQFAVNLSNPTTNTVTMRYTTGNQTAGEGDYGVTSGSLTFAPGQTSKVVSIAVKGDTRLESSETFKVNFSSVTNANILDSQAIGTIKNDD